MCVRVCCRELSTGKRVRQHDKMAVTDDVPDDSVQSQLPPPSPLQQCFGNVLPVSFSFTLRVYINIVLHFSRPTLTRQFVCSWPELKTAN